MSEQPGPGASPESGDGGPDGSSSSGQSANVALRIVSLATTVAAITTEADTSPSAAHDVTFVAIVTDEQGLDAIAGGTLVDESGATYGAFGAGAQKGTYAATLSWTQATTVRPLSFAPPGPARTFSAKFFDNAGNQATATAKVSFFCGSKHDYSACNGACEDPTTAHGACGCPPVACEQASLCYAGACEPPPNQACVDSLAYPAIHSCNEYCQRKGAKRAESNDAANRVNLEFPNLASCSGPSAGKIVAPSKTFDMGKAYYCECVWP